MTVTKQSLIMALEASVPRKSSRGIHYPAVVDKPLSGFLGFHFNCTGSLYSHEKGNC